jgi:putative tricarboxylic transport membrane protein
MKNRDLVSSIVFMVIGALFVQESLRKTLVEDGIPGAGFLPLLVGSALMLISLSLLISALLSKEKVVGFLHLFPDRVNAKKVLYCLIAMIAYASIMKLIGFLVATFIFVLCLGWIIEPKKWRTAAIFSFFTAAISHAFFVSFLKVPLPMGLLIELIIY